MRAFIARSATFSGRIKLAGPIERVFELFSPLGEKLWVPEWDPEILHPPEAEWEEGLIFRMREESGDAVWIVTRLDRSAYQVSYYRVEPSHYVARIDVRCKAVTAETTEAKTIYSYVGLSESGNEEIAAMTQESYEEKMARWRNWINEHLQGSRSD